MWHPTPPPPDYKDSHPFFFFRRLPASPCRPEPWNSNPVWPSSPPHHPIGDVLPHSGRYTPHLNPDSEILPLFQPYLLVYQYTRVYYSTTACICVYASPPFPLHPSPFLAGLAGFWLLLLQLHLHLHLFCICLCPPASLGVVQDPVNGWMDWGDPLSCVWPVGLSGRADSQPCLFNVRQAKRLPDLSYSTHCIYISVYYSHLSRSQR